MDEVGIREEIKYRHSVYNRNESERVYACEERVDQDSGPCEDWYEGMNVKVGKKEKEKRGGLTYVTAIRCPPSGLK